MTHLGKVNTPNRTEQHFTQSLDGLFGHCQSKCPMLHTHTVSGINLLINNISRWVFFCLFVFLSLTIIMLIKSWIIKVIKTIFFLGINSGMLFIEAINNIMLFWHFTTKVHSIIVLKRELTFFIMDYICKTLNTNSQKNLTVLVPAHGGPQGIRGRANGRTAVIA